MTTDTDEAWHEKQTEMLDNIAKEMQEYNEKTVETLKKFHATICECTDEDDKKECLDTYIQDCLIAIGLRIL